MTIMIVYFMKSDGRDGLGDGWMFEHLGCAATGLLSPWPPAWPPPDHLATPQNFRTKDGGKKEVKCASSLFSASTVSSTE